MRSASLPPSLPPTPLPAPSLSRSVALALGLLLSSTCYYVRQGILYEPSQNVIDDFPQFPVAWNYDELKAEFLAADARTSYPPY